eukprot:scaffold329647_cov95-Tisochrysis_lutea.AAC.1
MPLPRRSARLSSAARKAAYPPSRSKRCCGSIAAASAGDTLKHLLSKYSTESKKPPWRTRRAIWLSCASVGSISHRSVGTSVICSAAHAATRQASSGVLAPPGRTALVPLMLTADTDVLCFVGSILVRWTAGAEAPFRFSRYATS